LKLQELKDAVAEFRLSSRESDKESFWHKKTDEKGTNERAMADVHESSMTLRFVTKHLPGLI
jgi:hypothetical protein